MGISFISPATIKDNLDIYNPAITLYKQASSTNPSSSNIPDCYNYRSI